MAERSKHIGPNGRFLPGNPGGPGRRPGYASFKESLTAALSRLGEDGREEREAITDAVIRLARKGVPWAVEFCADRTEGKPTVQVQVAPANRYAGLSDDELREMIELIRIKRAKVIEAQPPPEPKRIITASGREIDDTGLAGDGLPA